MKDQFNRTINYMRISLSEKCNYSCYYCKGEKSTRKKQLEEEELFRIVEAAIALGIRKFKITGGEPFMRENAVALLLKLKHMEKVEEVSVTTNGSLLTHNDIDQLREIDGINFSLNSLDASTYYSITGSTSIAKVMDNILYAASVGIKVKINCVLSEKICAKDIMSLLHFAIEQQLIVRFIELMPMKQKNGNTMREEDVIRFAKKGGIVLTPVTVRLGNGPAHYYQVQNTYVGFISPIHGKFCATCNRVRLRCDGYLKTCLFHPNGCDLQDKIANQEGLIQAMKEAIYHKPAEHAFEKRAAGISMSNIGG